MLERGEIDGLIAPRIPSCVDRGAPNVDWLFADPTREASEFYRRTKIFPIMHLLGVRRTLAEQHPWLPAAALKAFEQSKAIALARLRDTSATKVTLPFVEEQMRAARALMGEDYWPYGFDANKAVLEKFLHHHHAQGLSPRLLKAEELFHPTTLESHKI
jgi:4,5-dihydroxyphthalate decarboxylase